MNHLLPYRTQGSKSRDRRISEFVPFASRRRSSSYGYRPKRRSKSDGFCRLLSGRCFMKPLLGGPRVRSRSRSRYSVDSRRNRRSSSLPKSSTGPTLAFGEIDFLKSKLGFTLPTAEATVKSASLRPNGKLRTLSDNSKRFSNCLRELGDYMICPDLKMPEGPSRISRVLRMSHVFPPGNISRLVNRGSKQRLGPPPDYMLRARNRELARIETILRQLESSVRTVEKKKERAILHQEDGSVAVYTQQQLDSLYDTDGATLKAVKSRIAADRSRATKQRRQPSVALDSVTGTMATSGGSFNVSVLFDRMDTPGKKRVSINLSDMFKV